MATRRFIPRRPARRCKVTSRSNSKHTIRITISIRIFCLQSICFNHSDIQYNYWRLKSTNKVFVLKLFPNTCESKVLLNLYANNSIHNSNCKLMPFLEFLHCRNPKILRFFSFVKFHDLPNTNFMFMQFLKNYFISEIPKI